MTRAPEFHVVGRASYRSVLRTDLGAVPLATIWQRGEPLVGAKGRGGARVVQLTDEVAGVARDFRRGGALGFLLSRSYFVRTRPERELRILAALRAAGVPVVDPLVAASRRHFVVCHRLRLITRLVPDALPLPAFIAAFPGDRRDAVREAGRVTGLAFRAGLVHPDLHPDNFIGSRGPDGTVQVLLLDLDRAKLLPDVPTPLRDRMLIRVARYLCRHAGQLPIRPAAGDTLRFLAGIGMSRSERRDTLRRIGPPYRRALRRHGLD